MDFFYVKEAEKRQYSLDVKASFSVNEIYNVFSLRLKEAGMSDSMNIRLGEKYPVVVQVTPSGAGYDNFIIDKDRCEAKVYNTAGGSVDAYGDIIVDNDKKTVTFLWDTAGRKDGKKTLVNYSPQQYIIIMWVGITYTDSEGNVQEILLASDNITKSLIRSSRLE